jgi:hypothetical protein
MRDETRVRVFSLKGILDFEQTILLSVHKRLEMLGLI